MINNSPGLECIGVHLDVDVYLPLFLLCRRGRGNKTDTKLALPQTLFCIMILGAQERARASLFSRPPDRRVGIGNVPSTSSRFLDERPF